MTIKNHINDETKKQVFKMLFPLIPLDSLGTMVRERSGQLVVCIPLGVCCGRYIDLEEKKKHETILTIFLSPKRSRQHMRRLTYDRLYLSEG